MRSLFALSAVALALVAIPVAAQARTMSDPSGFVLEIVLSRAAAARLAELDESITVGVVYYGDPLAAHRAEAGDDGSLMLGAEEVTIPGRAGRATIEGESFMVERRAWITGEAQVNVNIVSARQRHPDNLLNCDFIDGSLALVGGRAHDIVCSLIVEQRVVRSIPAE